MQNSLQYCIALMVVTAVCGGSVGAQEEGAVPPSGVTLAHPFQRVSLIRAELDLIRLELGKPRVERLLLDVENGAAREG